MDGQCAVVDVGGRRWYVPYILGLQLLHGQLLRSQPCTSCLDPPVTFAAASWKVLAAVPPAMAPKGPHIPLPLPCPLLHSHDLHAAPLHLCQRQVKQGAAWGDGVFHNDWQTQPQVGGL